MELVVRHQSFWAEAAKLSIDFGQGQTGTGASQSSRLFRVLGKCVVVAQVSCKHWHKLVPKERDWSADMTSTSSSPRGRRQDGVKQEVSVWAHPLQAVSIKLPKEEQICRKRFIHQLFVNA